MFKKVKKVCHYLGGDKGGGGSRQTVRNGDNGGGVVKIVIFTVIYLQMAQYVLRKYHCDYLYVKHIRKSVEAHKL